MIKLSSPNLNYLVVAGAIILYTSVYLYIFSERAGLHDALCNVRKVKLNVVIFMITQLQQWTFSLGYNLCFAVILAKTWRIYHIFSNPAPKKKVWIVSCMLTIISYFHTSGTKRLAPVCDCGAGSGRRPFRGLYRHNYTIFSPQSYPRTRQTTSKITGKSSLSLLICTSNHIVICMYTKFRKMTSTMTTMCLHARTTIPSCGWPCPMHTRDSCSSWPCLWPSTHAE